MQTIQMDDQLYEDTQRRASAAGFASVDAYVADLLNQDFSAPQEFDHLFPPERLAYVDNVIAEIEAGQPYAPEQVDAHLAETKTAPIKEDAG